MIKLKSAKLSRLMLRYCAPDPQFVEGQCFVIWDDGAVSRLLAPGLHPGQGVMWAVEDAFKVCGIDAGFFSDLGNMQFRDHYYAFTNEAGWRAIREYLGYHERMVIDYLETLA